MDWLGIDRRRLGTGVMVFGLVGVVAAGIVAVALVMGALAARDLDERLEADQARIAASLTRLSVTMDSLALTTDNAGTTLQASSETVAEAQAVLAGTADALLTLSSSLDVTILGNRPFETASERLAELARTIAAFDTKAQELAFNLHRNADDAALMADQVRDLRTQVTELAARITGFDRIGELVAMLIGGIVLTALLTAWVAMGAAFCAWVGWRLRRPAATVPAP